MVNVIEQRAKSIKEDKEYLVVRAVLGIPAIIFLVVLLTTELIFRMSQGKSIVVEVLALGMLTIGAIVFATDMVNEIRKLRR